MRNTASALDLRTQVRDLAQRWRDAGRYLPATDNWMRGFDREFSKQLAELGLIGMTWPARVGGGERRHVDRLVVTEELLRAGAPVAAHWIADRQIGPAILRHGSPHLQAEILPGIVTADFVFCLGMSEPEAGSDLASLTTRAERDGEDYLLRGRKVWTTGAHHATHAYVLARTSVEERRQQGLSEFIVDMSAPGVHVSPIVDIAGEHHFNEVTFDDVRVPASRVLGVIGHGWQQVIEQLSFERGGPERLLSSYPLLADAVVTSTDDAADEQLGALIARLATLRRMAYAIAERLDAGDAPVQQAATLKLLGNEFERDVVEFVRRSRSADAAATSDLGMAMLSAPGFAIRGGAADVMLSLIARAEVGR